MHCGRQVERAILGEELQSAEQQWPAAAHLASQALSEGGANVIIATAMALAIAIGTRSRRPRRRPVRRPSSRLRAPLPNKTADTLPAARAAPPRVLHPDALVTATAGAASRPRGPRWPVGVAGLHSAPR